MPTIPDIKEEIDDPSVVFVAICTRSDESCKECTDANNIGTSAVHGLPVSPCGRQNDVRTTPKIFSIDKENKIASKGTGMYQIAEVTDLLKKNKAYQAARYN